MAWQTTGGNLRGPQGLPGSTGPAGRGVATAAVNASGELVITFSDSTSANLGVVKGAKGDAGTGITLTGSVASQANLPTGLTNTPTDIGKAYVTQDTGLLYVWLGTSWSPGAPFKGDQGDPGTPGEPGAPGARGSKWYTGSGAPGTIAGSLPGDFYLDQTTGNVYAFN